MKKLIVMLSVTAMIVFSVSACGNGNDTNHAHSSNNNHHDEHSDMNHSSSGELPDKLQEAAAPTFPVGSEAMIRADHMEGMNGATATIVGAYDTIVYTVSYMPTTGGEKVTDHKWVIHEELMNAGDAAFEQGTEVVLQADHMKGMDGATATIDSAEQTTVYMVDYVPTTGEGKVTNHKWVTESELEAP
ncbi:YdhK family protein [Marinicrinis sediminis]|uniref:YdhK family protein n=1 Tax=Marinicrinis sediminis TaxID=1652465 RepID=A0ABW5RCQ7_9BACL